MALPEAVRKLPLRVRMQAAIEKLEARERQVLSLMVVEGLTALETAGAMGLSKRAVETSYQSAIEAIAAETGARKAQRRAA
jgi:DNA-directed RNA polymerase specialized sigma24 family protein